MKNNFPYFGRVLQLERTSPDLPVIQQLPQLLPCQYPVRHKPLRSEEGIEASLVDKLVPYPHHQVDVLILTDSEHVDLVRYIPFGQVIGYG